MSPYEHDRAASMEPRAVVYGETLTLPSQEQLAALGLDDASLAVATEEAAARVGPDAMARAADNVTAWHDYAAAVHRALPVDPEADATVEALMVKHANHATRPIRPRVP